MRKDGGIRSRERREPDRVRPSEKISSQVSSALSRF